MRKWVRARYASWKVMDGVDLRTVAELLGHRTLAMVMRYSHLSPDHLDKVREKGIMVSLWSVENSSLESHSLK
ncbi:MAG: tyrosine-type recombinase/integrase [candidate division WOR-3 bacterium]